MENNPFELEPSLEKSIIQGFHERGGRHPDVQDLLTVWVEQENLKTANTSEAQIESDLRLGRLYLSGELFDEAFDMFSDALYRAQQENKNVLVHKIQKEIDEITELTASLKP